MQTGLRLPKGLQAGSDSESVQSRLQATTHRPKSDLVSMSELFHECGVAAVYHLANRPPSPLISGDDPNLTARLIPRMLLDMQNRGQLSAGLTSYRENRGQLIDTYKEIGSVQEVFRLSHSAKCESLMNEYSGRAAIGHVRYATCGKDDRSYAQPFERHHIDKGKWFSFGFNGQLANYGQLRKELLDSTDHHLARESDTELMMHLISRHLSQHKPGGREALIDMITSVAGRLDGAWSLAYLNAASARNDLQRLAIEDTSERVRIAAARAVELLSVD